MNLKNPHMVFKCPGSMAMHDGSSYDWMVVDADEVQAFVKQGWHASIVDAKASVFASAPEPEEAPDDDAPPTRAELEEQCKKLGIKVDGRYSDKRLLAMIAEKMG